MSSAEKKTDNSMQTYFMLAQQFVLLPFKQTWDEIGKCFRAARVCEGQEHLQDNSAA